MKNAKKTFCLFDPKAYFSLCGESPLVSYGPVWTTKARKYHVNVECVGSLWAYSIIRICMYQFNGVDNFLKLHWN